MTSSLSSVKRYRPHENQGQESADEWNLSAVPQDDVGQVLSGGVPEEALPKFGGTSKGS